MSGEVVGFAAPPPGVRLKFSGVGFGDAVVVDARFGERVVGFPLDEESPATAARQLDLARDERVGIYVAIVKATTQPAVIRRRSQ